MKNNVIGRCDILDVLEEAAIFCQSVHVDLHDRREGFTARVRDVYTEGGEEYVIFEDHERLPVSDISGCRTTDDQA